MGDYDGRRGFTRERRMYVETDADRQVVVVTVSWIAGGTDYLE